MASATKKKVTRKRTTTKKKVVAKKNDFTPTIFIENDNDPRHNLFEAYFTNPDSPTFSNALQSAIRSGYSKTYADNILHLRPKWLSDIIGRMDSTRLALKARKNLEEDLNMDIVEQAMGAFGPIFKAGADGKKTIPVMVRNAKFIEARQKATFFVAEKVDPLFNKSKKDEDGANKVVFNNIFIMNPDGNTVPYNQTNSETIPGLSELIDK